MQTSILLSHLGTIVNMNKINKVEPVDITTDTTDINDQKNQGGIEQTNLGDKFEKDWLNFRKNSRERR